MSVFSKAFVRYALERALKTVAQAILALLTAGSLSLMDVDWGHALGVAGLAGLMSILTSVISVTGGASAPADGSEPEAPAEQAAQPVD